MESALAQRPYKCEALGETLEIRQLSAMGLAEIIDASKDSRNDVMLAAITCRHGVIAWREYSATEIAEAQTPDTILELAQAIDELTPSRTKKKPSEKDQAAVSSLDLPSRSGKTRAK